MLLLDTHIALWLVREPGVLRPAELAAIEGSEPLVSAISLWELRLKWDRVTASGARKGPADPLEIRTGLEILGVNILPLVPDQAAASLKHPIPHRDPFDEMLLIQAQELGAKLLTRDRLLIDHPLAIAP
jgi:PIN domain nuclease of toxin-antitoxin system